MRDNEQEPEAYTITDWCRSMQISRSTFYRRRSEMPTGISVGDRIRITKEESAAWKQRQKDRSVTTLGQPNCK
jgi:predicted DNA-binding transcriptional regulator AlpA